MNIQWEDYDHFGFPLKVPQALSFISAMADTGRQSCLAGLKVVTKPGVSIRELIPVNIKMQTANNDNICTLGTTVLSLPGKNNEGEEQSQAIFAVVLYRMETLIEAGLLLALMLTCTT